MSAPPHITMTDIAGAGVIVTSIVILLREVRAIIALKNNNAKKVLGTLDSLPIKIPLSDHCRSCHGLLGEVRVYQESLEKALPASVKEAFNKVIVNQVAMIKCQKEMLANQTKIIGDMVLMEEHCEGRYTGTKRAIKEVMDELKKHKTTIATAAEVLRLVQEHNAKSAKVIDQIMREKEL